MGFVKERNLLMLSSSTKTKIMKQLKTVFCLTLFIALFFSACKKDDDQSNSSPDTTSVIVTASVSGIITNQEDIPLNDVMINLSTNTAMTDQNGYFSFQNVNINTKGSLITAEKDGYFHNAKFVHSKANKQNFTKIKLLEKELSGTFLTSAGATVITNGDASIKFPANAIKKEGGSTYTGNVNVYATWLDPTATDLAQRMPGDLRAINTDNVQQQLTSFGMIGVELESETGEALNIADGQRATIELPVPNSLLANAPATIPLWHFDESSGYWIEDGEATLEGDKYVGNVSHFSFWNCDVPRDYAYINGTLTDNDGKGIHSLTVVITEVSTASAGNGITDEDGLYQGFVPGNVDLMLRVLDNCGAEIYSSSIGPFSGDETISPIQIDTEDHFIKISGKLVNCDNNPTSDAYFLVASSFIEIINVDANGNFSQFINTCNGNNIMGTAFDRANSKQSPTVNYEINGQTNLDIGTITVCEDLVEYITYTINGNEFSYDLPKASYSESDNVFIINDIQSDFYVLVLSSIQVGIKAPDETHIRGDNGTATYFGLCSNIGSNSPDCDQILNITLFEGIGGFVEGTIEASLTESNDNSQVHTITAEFRILIESF